LNHCAVPSDNVATKTIQEQKPEQDPTMVMNLLDAQFERLVEMRIHILRAFHEKTPSASQENLD
jgi:hypothetical protein